MSETKNWWVYAVIDDYAQRRGIMLDGLKQMLEDETSKHAEQLTMFQPEEVMYIVPHVDGTWELAHVDGSVKSFNTVLCTEDSCAGLSLE